MFLFFILGNIKRTWINEEKVAVEEELSEFIKNRRLPSLTKCKAVIMARKELTGRTPEMLKAYINNLFKKEKSK